MPEHFCTYFDHRYAAKGLAMWRSLKAHRPDAVLHVLCLDQACEAVLSALQLADVVLHPLAALEGDDAELATARATRSRVEYYFTLTPCFPRYLFRSGAASTRLTYVDADLFFLADPQPVFEELGPGSVAIIEHRFSPEIADRIAYGRFNVGWVTFRQDTAGLACLDLWREECLAWCHDRLDGDRFADQKYLDRWPDRFPEVVVIQHPGANLAPWNLGRHIVSDSGHGPMADGRPVLFYHAHGFEPAGPGRPRALNLSAYGVVDNETLERVLFTPYERALQAATETVAMPLVLTVLSGAPRDVPRQTDALVQALLAAGADRDYYQRELRASRAYVGTLEERLNGITAQQRTASDALDGAREERAAEQAAQRAEQDALHRRIAELEAALTAQRAELLAETFKVGTLTTAAAAEKEARAALEQQWAATRQDAHTVSTRLGALEARLEIEAARRAEAESRLAGVDRAREDAALGLAASRAECQSLSASLEQVREAQAAQATAAAALAAEKEAAVAATAAARAESAALASALEQERQSLAARTAALAALTIEKDVAAATAHAESTALTTALEQARGALAAMTREKDDAVEHARAEATALSAARAESEAMAAIAERERGARTHLEVAVSQATAARADAETALAASRAEGEARAAMLTEVQATIARLGSDLEAIGRRVGALTTQLNREERQRMDAVRDAAGARAETDAARAREQEARSTIDQLARDLAQTRAQLEEARTNWYHADGNLKVVKGSLSWKITGPLRVLRDAIIGPAQHG
ncbi:MAG: hypothetical protein U0Q55_19085 [Vicinamibacterales bacterium]